MEDFDTSAGRLAGILEDFRQHGNDQAIAVWRKVFDTEDPLDVVEKLVELKQLYDLVVHEVRQLPEEDGPSRLLKTIAPISHGFGLIPAVSAHQAAEFGKYFTETAVEGLHFCAITLRRRGVRAPTIRQKDLLALRSDIREWMDLVAENSQLNRHDKTFILQRLVELENALLGFHIGGFDSLEVAVAALAGAVLVVDGPQREGLWIKTTQFFTRVLNLAQGARSIATASEETIKAIDSVKEIISGGVQ